MPHAADAAFNVTTLQISAEVLEETSVLVVQEVLQQRRRTQGRMMRRRLPMCFLQSWNGLERFWENVYTLFLLDLEKQTQGTEEEEEEEAKQIELMDMAPTR